MTPWLVAGSFCLSGLLIGWFLGLLTAWWWR